MNQEGRIGSEVAGTHFNTAKDSAQVIDSMPNRSIEQMKSQREVQKIYKNQKNQGNFDDKDKIPGI